MGIGPSRPVPFLFWKARLAPEFSTLFLSRSGFLNLFTQPPLNLITCPRRAKMILTNTVIRAAQNGDGIGEISHGQGRMFVRHLAAGSIGMRCT